MAEMDPHWWRIKYPFLQATHHIGGEATNHIGGESDINVYKQQPTLVEKG